MVIQDTHFSAEVFCVLFMKTGKKRGFYNYSTEKCPLVLSVHKLMLASKEKKVITLLLGIHMETSINPEI